MFYPLIVIIVKYWLIMSAFEGKISTLIECVTWHVEFRNESIKTARKKSKGDEKNKEMKRFLTT